MQKRNRSCVICFLKVSKLKNPEEHDLQLLQSYMPWRNQSELKQDNKSYEDRYKEAEDDIMCNVTKHEPYLDIDYEELENFSFVQSDVEEEDNTEYSIISPDLLDLDLEVIDGVSDAPVTSVTVDNLLLPSQKFCELCSQLNEGQQHLFNFVMQHAVYCKLAEKNTKLEPNPFQIFVSGGAGVGKSFLVTTKEYLKGILRYPSQNPDNPSFLVTASTGKAATNVNGITLYSPFNLPVKSGLKLCGYQKPSDETLHKLRNKYQYLKVLITDEISMIRRETFEDLDLALKNIKQNLLQFGGVSLLLVGDFLQFPSVNQKSVFMKSSKGSYRSFSGWLWEKFQLHELNELVEIVRQSSDPDFAQLRNRVREGQHRNNDLTQIKALTNTNTAT